MQLNEKNMNNESNNGELSQQQLDEVLAGVGFKVGAEQALNQSNTYSKEKLVKLKEELQELEEIEKGKQR